MRRWFDVENIKLGVDMKRLIVAVLMMFFLVGCGATHLKPSALNDDFYFLITYHLKTKSEVLNRIKKIAEKLYSDESLQYQFSEFGFLSRSGKTSIHHLWDDLTPKRNNLSAIIVRGYIDSKTFYAIPAPVKNRESMTEYAYPQSSTTEQDFLSGGCAPLFSDRGDLRAARLLCYLGYSKMDPRSRPI